MSRQRVWKKEVSRGEDLSDVRQGAGQHRDDAGRDTSAKPEVNKKLKCETGDAYLTLREKCFGGAMS